MLRVAFVLSVLVSSLLSIGATEASAADEGDPWGFTTPCPDLIVYGARGSGQLATDHHGLGPEVATFYSAIKQAADAAGVTVGYRPLAYTASRVEDGLVRLFDSVEDGVQSAVATASIIDGVCGSDTKVVLIGYSQGAMVMHEALQFFEERLTTAVFLGDPYFNPDEGGDKVGGFEAKQGILGAVDEDAAYDPALFSVCLRGDIVCQGDKPSLSAAFNLWRNGTQTHSVGYRTGLAGTFADQAAAKIMAQLGHGDIAEGASVAAALIIDSSGSMSDEDPNYLRREGALAYIAAAPGTDRVGIVDFDDSARVLSPAVDPVVNRSQLTSALDSIDADGGTDIGTAVTTGCGVLKAEQSARSKIGVLLTDGQGSYADEADCFAQEGWRLYTFGLGSGSDDVLLNDIALQTGGRFEKLDDTTDMVCEFQRVRAEVAGNAAQGCGPAGTIEQGQTTVWQQTVGRSLRQVTFTITWPGSDMEMSLVSPSGRRITRETLASDLTRSTGSTFDSVTVTDPEPGVWSLEVYGADVAPGGEPYTLQQVDLAAPNSAPIPRIEVHASGRRVTVDAAASTDADGRIVAYEWLFGDGGLATTPSASHTYAADGRYPMALLVADDEGAVRQANLTVTVRGVAAPVAAPNAVRYFTRCDRPGRRQTGRLRVSINNPDDATNRPVEAQVRVSRKGQGTIGKRVVTVGDGMRTKARFAHLQSGRLRIRTILDGRLQLSRVRLPVCRG